MLVSSCKILIFMPMPTGIVARNAENAIRAWLAQSKAKEGTRLPSERELARTLGLTYYSVNRAMARLIGCGLVRRNGYVLTYGLPQTEPAGFTLDLFLPSSPPVLAGFRQVADHLKLQVRTHPWTTAEDFVQHLHQLLKRGTDGILVAPPSTCPSSRWEPALMRIIEKGIPCVCFGATKVGIPCVTEDRYLAMNQIFDRLQKAGHTEAALITMPAWSPSSYDVVKAWQQECAHRGMTRSAERVIYGGYLGPHETLRDLGNYLRKTPNSITALAIHGSLILPRLLDALAAQKIKVPDDLTIVSLGDPRAHMPQCDMSCAAFDLQLEREIGLRMLERSVRIKRESGKMPGAEKISIAPFWVERGSIRSFRSAQELPEQPEPTPPAQPPFLMLSGDSEQCAQEIEAMTHRQYELTFRVPPSRFASVPLERFVNRPINFRRGWLGDQPLHLTPGEHRIHGIPFGILGGPKREDAGAIIFRSSNNRIGQSRPLPESVRIPIHRKAQAIYILHGCGFAQALTEFAIYRFHGQSGLIGSVPLVSLGRRTGAVDYAQWEKDCQRANIQDWWPDFPQTDFPHARTAPVLQTEGEERELRYLYTLEWVNPAPEEKVEWLEIRTDTLQETTLGVLGVSVLLCKEPAK